MKEKKSSSATPTISKEFFDLTKDGGELGELIRAVDWSKTSVGVFESWPQSLKTALSICLGSKFPMLVWWGKDLAVFYNDSYVPFAGLKHPQYLGLPAREQWAEIWEDLRPLTEQVLKTGRATWAESMLLFLNRKGFLEESYFTFSYSPIRDESGGVGGIINPCQETTERILGERRLNMLHSLSSCETKSILGVGESSAKTLGSNTYDIPFALIYLIDADGKTATLIGTSGIKAGTSATPKIIELNSKSQDIWQLNHINYTQQPERTEGFRSLFFEDLPAAPYEEKPDSAYVLPMILPTQETPAGFLILGISPRLMFDDHYQEFFGLVCRQITTHIANVCALEEEQKRTEAMAEIDRAKTTFFSNISHEFRTPLTLMLGPIEDMLLNSKEKLTPSLRSEIEIVHRNALRLLKLVNTLLDFSRVEANRTQAHYELIDLASLTTYLANAFETAIRRAGIKLTVECPLLPEPVYVDKNMWEKIVLNLMSNAFKYTLKGEITVSLHSVMDAVELKVRDTGAGIPEEELPKLFQRFHRVQGVQGRTHEGTGIGLALVKELVMLHGGTINVESALGQGSVFIVRIPVGFVHLPKDRISQIQKELQSTTIQTEMFAEESLRWLPEDLNHETHTTDFTDHLTAEKNPSSVEDQNQLRKKRIVLADDNVDMRNYICKLLSGPYEVIAVANGKEAYEVMSKQRPDLVVSDIMMPVMDGIELLKAIRADQSLQTIPVILLSARAGEEAKANGIELGADDYLTKPFSSMELQARVQTQLNLAETRTALLRKLEFANNELESFSFSVSHDLRAPLRSIMGFSSAVLEDFGQEIKPQAAEDIKKVINSAKKMGELIDGLLSLSRLTRSEINYRPVNLSQIATVLSEDFKREQPVRKVNFLISKDIVVNGDTTLLQAMMTNLLSNAWKFTAKTPDAQIEFGKEIKEGTVRYYIRDNGAGFDMQYANKLFGAFQRLHSMNEFAGNGIGLATVQRIIKKHGGDVWAEAQPNKGATFYFTI